MDDEAYWIVASAVLLVGPFARREWGFPDGHLITAGLVVTVIVVWRSLELLVPRLLDHRRETVARDPSLGKRPGGRNATRLFLKSGVVLVSLGIGIPAWSFARTKFPVWESFLFAAAGSATLGWIAIFVVAAGFLGLLHAVRAARERWKRRAVRGGGRLDSFRGRLCRHVVGRVALTQAAQVEPSA